MEEKSSSTVRGTSLKWGVINGVVGIGFFVVLDLLGLVGNQSYQWIGVLFFIVLLILAHREFKSEGEGYMSYGEGLGIGTLISLISSIISSIFTFAYVSYINSDIITVAREKALLDMEEQGRSAAEIEQATPFIEMFTSPTAFLIIGLIGGVFIGFMVSLVVSAITQKKRPENLMA